MVQTKLELSVELLADTLEEDNEGREAFQSILAVTIQDELDRGADELGTVILTDTQIVEVSARAAADFVATLTNQND